MSFTLANTVDPKKIFLLPRSGLLKRLDPAYYSEILNNKLEFSHPTTTIAKAVKSYTGGTPDKSKLEFWNGNTPWASPKDMKEFYLSETEDKITEDAVLNTSTSIAPAGSVIIVFRSGILQHTLPVSITKIRTAINQDLKVLIPSHALMPEYLAVYLKTFEKRILPRIVKHSTTVQSINQEEFNLLPIPIPPKAIQERVIRINQQFIEQKIKNETAAEKLLSSINDYLLKELGITLPTPPVNILKNRIYTASIKSISGNRFDPFFHQKKFQDNIQAIHNGKFPVKTLREIISGNLIKGTLPNHEEKVGSNSVIQINCINADGTISFDDLLTAKNIFSKEQKLKTGDVLVVITGATIGKVAQWNYDGDFFLGGDIVKFQTNSLADNSFVFHFMRSNPIQIEIRRNITGATNGHLSPDDVKHFPIPVPPIDKQVEIASHITEIRKQAQTLKDKTKVALKKASEEIEEILIGK